MCKTLVFMGLAIVTALATSQVMTSLFTQATQAITASL